MSTNRLKIEVNTLKEGMFVSDLDRPWHETPFPLQGFYIRIDDDIKALADYCKYVYIDVQKQKSASAKVLHTPFDSKPPVPINVKHNAQVVNLPPIVIKSPTTYETVNSIHKEVSKASKLHKHVYEAISQVFSSVLRDDLIGLKETVKETENVAEGMVESVIRNPDALVWLSKMNDQDAYSYQHSVKASIWSLVFGRHLGLNKVQLKSLAMGVLLAQIGKTKLSQEVLDSVEEAGTKNRAYQEYIQHSLSALSEMDDLPKGVIQIVEFHQERHNGTGFPKGVTGEKIPLLAKIAGLVHHYQELITPRDDDAGLSPLAAVSKLYELRNISFQQDLVERFIEAIGVYPTGTLVELSSDEIGIVTGHNQDRRLLPKVMVVLDEHKQKLKHGKIIDLKERSMTGKPTDAIFIRDSLPKGAYDIDENQYLLSGATSKWSWRHISSSIVAS